MKKSNSRKTIELLHRRDAPLETRTDLTPSATKDIAAAMNAVAAIMALGVLKPMRARMIERDREALRAA